MANIYRGAVRTVIWLGRDEGFASEAFGLIFQIFTVVEREHPEHENMLGVGGTSFDEKLHAERGLSAVPLQTWHSLGTLLSRPWFERLWVLQEVVLSNIDAITICGTEECSWYVISTVCSWLVSNCYFVQGYCPGTTYNVDRMRYVCEENGELDLPSLTFLTQEFFQATDARDKVYGLLGLVKRDERDCIVPDYTLPPEAVYRDLARNMICEQGNLACLGMPLGYNKHIRDPFRWAAAGILCGGGPSWVPQLQVHPVFFPSDQIGVINTDDGLGVQLTWPEQYRASGDVPSQVRDVPGCTGSAQLSILSLKGLEVGKVGYSFETNTNRAMHWQTEKWKQRTRFEKSSWKDWRAQALRLYGCGSGLRRPVSLTVWSAMLERWPNTKVVALAKSMCEVMACNSRIDYKSLEEADFDDFCAYVVGVHDTSGHKFGSTARRFHTSFAVLRTHARDGIASRYDMLLEAHSHVRGCFFTEDGRLGMGPASMRKGDRVVVLFGAGTPFVLRPRKDKWLLLGDCYVSGLMAGESIEKWQAGELQEQWFDIA